MELHVVVGAQYGSEAKGHMVQQLTQDLLSKYQRIRVVRVAGPNAGHTGHTIKGEPMAFRQLPVAAVVDTYKRGVIDLHIAPGSEIDFEVLVSEIRMANGAGLMNAKTLTVSAEATVIDDSHKTAEAIGDLTGKLGSTGKGIGAARADRVMRKASRLADRPDLIHQLEALNVAVWFDKSGNRRQQLDPRDGIPTVVEGTQGYGLGLRAGHYPQTTSSDCRAIDFLAMAGINPWDWEHLQVWAVARVYPIRVAGNSGPLKNETSWEALGLKSERTTVTQKIRRVGMPDWDLVRDAVVANGNNRGTVRLAVFMLDQKFPEIAGAEFTEDLTDEIQKYIDSVEDWVGSEVWLLGTGPNTVVRPRGRLV